MIHERAQEHSSAGTEVDRGSRQGWMKTDANPLTSQGNQSVKPIEAELKLISTAAQMTKI